MAVENFVSRQIDLLEIEQDAEIEENKCLRNRSPSIGNLQRKVICLSPLRLTSSHTSLFGKYIFTFEPYSHRKSFREHNIVAGDTVGIAMSQDSDYETVASGIVSHVTHNTISVSFDENFDFLGFENDVQYQMYKLPNEVTYKLMKRTLLLLKNNLNSSRLIDVLFGETKPTEQSNVDIVCNTDELNSELDEHQKEAVRFAVSRQDAAVICGPPRTGKTTTLVEIILLSVKQQLKILACAPSHTAVDNIIEKLAPHKINMVKLDHPVHLLGHKQYSLDDILAKSEEDRMVNDIRNEIDTIREKAKLCKNQREREKFWKESRSLHRELREREIVAIERILRKADVILSTLFMSSNDGPLKYIPSGYFNMVVIDECSQAIEAACWIPLLYASKCVLAGDNNKQPLNIISDKAAKEGLAVSLIERLVQLYGDTVMRKLPIQYEKQEDINQTELCEDKSEHDSSVSQELLIDTVKEELTEETTVNALKALQTVYQSLELTPEMKEQKGNEEKVSKNNNKGRNRSVKGKSKLNGLEPGGSESVKKKQAGKSKKKKKKKRHYESDEDWTPESSRSESDEAESDSSESEKSNGLDSDKVNKAETESSETENWTSNSDSDSVSEKKKSKKLTETESDEESVSDIPSNKRSKSSKNLTTIKKQVKFSQRLRSKTQKETSEPVGKRPSRQSKKKISKKSKS